MNLKRYDLLVISFCILLSQQILKEEPKMKAIVMKYLGYAPHPGAATRRDQLHNFLDKCLLVASAAGIVAALMFLAVIV